MLRKTVTALSAGYFAVEKFCRRLSAGVLVALMFLTTADVAGRYLFNSPIYGAYEVSEVLMVAIVFLSLAYVQSEKGHVKVEALTSWMPKRAQLALDAAGYIIAFVIMALMTWRSGLLAWMAWITKDFTMSIIEIPSWPGKSILTLGIGLFCLRLLGDIVFTFAKLLPSNLENREK